MGLTEKQRWVRAISAGYQHVDMKFCMDLGLGNRFKLYDHPTPSEDDYINRVPRCISMDAFHYENPTTINGNIISTGIAIPKVDTNIQPDSQTEMINYVEGYRFELQVQQDWSKEERTTNIHRFVHDTYFNHILNTIPDPHSKYADLHQAVMDGINGPNKDADGNARYNVHDFSVHNTGKTLEFTWQLHTDANIHNMCVEFNKQTNEVKMVSEHRDENGDLLRTFSGGEYYEVYSFADMNGLGCDLHRMVEDVISERTQQETDLIDDLDQSAPEL